MEQVTKRPRPRVRCAWCKTTFKPKPLGRAPRFCSAKCRQAACVKRNGSWDLRIRQGEKARAHEALLRRLREELRPAVRQQLTREFIQSGLVRITGQDHVNALIAGRNEWRGNKLLDELAGDFAAAGNAEAVAAIREWQRRAREAGGQRRRRSDNPQPQQHRISLPAPAVDDPDD
jgi:hypothetical protein